MNSDILLMKETEIEPDMNAQELFDRLKVLGAEVLLETLEGLRNRTLIRMPQDHSRATYVTMMTRETGLIDWNKSAQEIHNLVRGTDPWPGAYTYYKGKRLKVWKTAVCSGSDGIVPGSGCRDSGETVRGTVCRDPEMNIPGPAAGEAGLVSPAGETRPVSSAGEARPGTILKCRKDGLIVATGSGLLAITELQFENARRMKVVECGHNMDVGEVFG